MLSFQFFPACMQLGWVLLLWPFFLLLCSNVWCGVCGVGWGFLGGGGKRVETMVIQLELFQCSFVLVLEIEMTGWLMGIGCMLRTRSWEIGFCLL